RRPLVAPVRPWRGGERAHEHAVLHSGSERRVRRALRLDHLALTKTRRRGFGRAAGISVVDRAHSCQTRRVSTRRTVSIVFADVSGWTSLGERLDPESLERVMQDYFRTARTVLERHGGTVEKFIGDAVMAVFGIPELQEDDALRAVRAAVEMRDALAELNDELEGGWGIRIGIRIGVNTGEVVAREPAGGESFAIGQPVNVAQRLEESAAPGEVLIGEPTFRLVVDGVVAEPLEPLPLKGSTEPVPAYRIVEVRRDLGVPVTETRIVGRGRELTLLALMLADVAERRSSFLLHRRWPRGNRKVAPRT